MDGEAFLYESGVEVTQVPARRFPRSPMAGSADGVDEARVGPAFPLAGGAAEPEPAPVADGTCPCCGQQWKNRSELDALIDAVQPRMAQILQAVIRSPGATAEQIAQRVYASDLDGGPLAAANAIRAIICQNRHVMSARGFKLVGRRGPAGGYTLHSVGRIDAA